MSLYLWKFHTKWSFTPGNSIYKIVLHSLEFQVKNQEPRPMEIPHNIFWITLRNSTTISFQIFWKCTNWDSFRFFENWRYKKIIRLSRSISEIFEMKQLCLEFLQSIFLITLELPCPQPSSVWMFSGIDYWKYGRKKIYI